MAPRDRAYSNAWEKFNSAVRDAVLTDDRLAQDRLYHAWVRVASLVPLHQAEEDHLPPEIRHRYSELETVMIREVAMRDDPTSARRTALSDAEAKEWLGEIVSMYGKVAKYGPNGGAETKFGERTS